MKKYLLILFSIALPVITNATDIVEIDGIFYELKPVKVGTAAVNLDPAAVGYKLYTGALSIPSTIEYDGNTYKVTEINQYAFMGCRELTSIELPEGLTTIGFGAFDGCSGLTKVNIPSTVTTINKWAFRDCSGLTRVSITDIAAWCEITFEDYGNPLYYAHHLFLEDEEITDLVIPDNVSTISDRVFNGFSSLKSVELGSGVVSIGSYAFAWCTSLASIVIPENVKELGSNAFLECEALADIGISGNIEKIGVSSFEKCNSLKTIRIPNGVKEVDTYAFRNCNKLEKIYISESVERIGASAFGNCENISDVYCFAIVPPAPNTIWYNALSNYFWQSYTEYSVLHVPETSVDSYKNAFTWSDFGTIVALTEEETAIKSSTLTKGQPESYYTINGWKSSMQHKGINIIKTGDGRTRKVVLK